MADRSRYRSINWLGARILQARELNKLQTIERQVDDNNVASAYELSATWRQGATFNVTPVITPGTKTVTLTATIGGQPMLVFVRNQWEILKVSEAPGITLLPSGPTQNNLYLNYQVVRVTSTDDVQLIDVSSGEAVAEMGELLMQVSATDDSARALGVNEFEKNTVTIQLFNFTHSGATVILNPLDNANAQALGQRNQAGVVKLSTSTAAGVVCATDDPRLSDARPVLAGSVVDASVRVPVAPGGSNADGTPIYNLSGDPGGISAAKIVYVAGTQLLSDAFNWLKTQFLALQTRYNAHEGFSLGSVTTHPMPTAQQVGAVPLSHVGQALGLPTSHPPTATMDVGGFRRVAASAAAPVGGDYSFGTQSFAGAILNGLLSDGNIFSLLADSAVANPRIEGGEVLTTGSLGLLATLAKVVSEHVNKYPNKNPHGLAPADIGAATTGYVDTGDTNTLNSSKIYTDSKVPHVSIFKQVVSSGNYLVITFAPNGGSPVTLAYGGGTVSLGSNGTFTIPLPDVSFTALKSIPTISVFGVPLQNGDIASIDTTQNGLAFSINVRRFNGSGSETPASGAFVTWHCLCWK